jgi:hypothetical protein
MEVVGVHHAVAETDHVVLDVLESLEGLVLVKIAENALEVFLDFLGQFLEQLAFVGAVVLVADEEAVLQSHMFEISF